jgi:hypothetical protein
MRRQIYNVHWRGVAAPDRHRSDPCRPDPCRPDPCRIVTGYFVSDHLLRDLRQVSADPKLANAAFRIVPRPAGRGAYKPRFWLCDDTGSLRPCTELEYRSLARIPVQPRLPLKAAMPGSHIH